MTASKVLIVYYSQTGQLATLAQQFAAPLQQAGITVDCVPLVPQQPYPFPWRFWHFFDTFPESAHLKPAPINPPQIPHNDYDVVVIAYTVWRHRSLLPPFCSAKTRAACSRASP